MRPIIQFCATAQLRGDVAHPIVLAYACRNGLAIGHPIKTDTDGDFKYAAGWIVYHAATGLTLRTRNPETNRLLTHATPAAAMNALRSSLRGKLLARVKIAASKATPAPDTKNRPEVIGKLKPWPKPTKRKGKVAPGCEHIAPDKNRALFALIAEIDAAALTASQKGESFVTFTFGRATYKVLHRFENLKRFRMQVLKNRRAFTDSAIQTAPQPKEQKAMTEQTPAIDRALATLHKNLDEPLQPAPAAPECARIAAPKLSKATASQTKPAKPRPWVPSWPERIKTATALRKNAALVIERKPPGFRWWLHRAVPVAKNMDRETLAMIKTLLAQAKQINAQV